MSGGLRVLACLLLTSPLAQELAQAETVASAASTARGPDGGFIRWREHIIDDPQSSGLPLYGGDGLVAADLDLDGREDIVSVHEGDAGYDSAAHQPGFVAPPEGYVRVAFATPDPQRWLNVTLAQGRDSPAPEDVAVGDINADGFADVLVAAELSHILYLQNPGRTARTAQWPRLVLPMTRGRVSYLRVFAADFNGDGQREVAAANKGAHIPGPEDFKVAQPVSVFTFRGDPLQGDSWREIELGRFSVPQNAEPVDLDGDGDMDLIAGSRGERRLVFFENLSSGDELRFSEHPIRIEGSIMSGFNLAYADLNEDGRLDIIGATPEGLGWIEQPEDLKQAWRHQTIGTFAPDSMTGIAAADIDGDGDVDIMAGSYSRGARQADGDVGVSDRLGRIGWFENRGVRGEAWRRHDISRRKRGMFDKFLPRDVDGDGDLDFIGTRGNSASYDGVFWLEQVRSAEPAPVFERARQQDSQEMPLP